MCVPTYIRVYLRVHVCMFVSACVCSRATCNLQCSSLRGVFFGLNLLGAPLCEAFGLQLSAHGGGKPIVAVGGGGLEPPQRSERVCCRRHPHETHTDLCCFPWRAYMCPPDFQSPSCDLRPPEIYYPPTGGQKRGFIRRAHIGPPKTQAHKSMCCLS